MIVPPYPVGQSGITFDFTAEPPTIGINVSVGGSLSSGSVQSGHIASGAVQGFFGSTRNIVSGTVGVSDFGSGAVIAGTVGSGAVRSGNITSGHVSYFHLASGAPCVIASGTAPNDPTIGQLWLDPGNSGATGLSSGSVTSGYLGNASVVSGSIASGQISWPHMASGYAVGQSGITFDFTAGPPTIGLNVPIDATNYVTNGGIYFSQRWSPTSNTIINGSGSTDVYSADCFKVGVSSGGRVSFQQFDRLTSGFASGVTSRYYGAWQLGASGHKFVVYQPILTNNSQSLSHYPINYQMQAKTPNASGLFVRFGILQTNSGVAPNIIPTRIASGYAVGTSGTDPTWGSGVSLLSPAISFQLTQAWQLLQNSGNASSGHVCLIPAIWMNAPTASGTTIHFTEVGLYND